MTKENKIFLGIGALSVISYWMLTTKNEVVESWVFPLKVKLGLAKYKKNGIAAKSTDKTTMSDSGYTPRRTNNDSQNWRSYDDYDDFDYGSRRGNIITNRDIINDFPISNNSGTINITNPTINHTHTHTHTHIHQSGSDKPQIEEQVSPVSQPYIYEVASFGNQTINMFGAELNLGERNFGNPPVTSFNYALNGWFGGGYGGYYALLQRTLSQPFIVGRIRMESPFSNQLMQPIVITDQNQTGKKSTSAGVQYLKLNQYFPGAVERECNMAIYGGTQLSYTQIADPTNPANQTSVKWYFWAASVASLTRFLEGKPMIKQALRPDTLLTPKASLPEPNRRLYC